MISSGIQFYTILRGRIRNTKTLKEQSKPLNLENGSSVSRDNFDATEEVLVRRSFIIYRA